MQGTRETQDSKPGRELLRGPAFVLSLCSFFGGTEIGQQPAQAQPAAVRTLDGENFPQRRVERVLRGRNLNGVEIEFAIPEWKYDAYRDLQCERNLSGVENLADFYCSYVMDNEAAIEAFANQLC